MVFTTFTGSISIPMNTRGFMTGEGKHCTESEGAGMTEIDATLQVIAIALFLRCKGYTIARMDKEDEIYG